MECKSEFGDTFIITEQGVEWIMPGHEEGRRYSWDRIRCLFDAELISYYKKTGREVNDF